MTTNAKAPSLCPSPLNDFGRGILDPTEEASLIEAGYVFAHRAQLDVQASPILFIARRPLAHVANALFLSADRALNDDPVSSRLPVPANVGG